MGSPRVIISGGGTGGHVFPAIAIADAIKAARPEAELLFVGAKGRLEMERVPAAGYPIEGLWISGFQRNLSRRNLSFPFKLISSLYRSAAIIRKFKPQAAVGVGGYASGPLLRMATGKKIPSLIQEQNSFPGITNRLLASRVQRICVAYEGMERWFPKEKIAFTGNPVRQQLLESGKRKQEAAVHFGLDPTAPCLLAIGGSQGARSINRGMEAAIPGLLEKGVQVIWQCGKSYVDEGAYAKSEMRGLKRQAFIERMDYAYAMADVVVSRAGAMSVSELCLLGKPSIFVPSPNVAEDHQTRNAQALVEKEAALLVADRDCEAQLGISIHKLLEDEGLRATMSRNIQSLARPDAARHIAEEVLKLIEKPKSAS